MFDMNIIDKTILYKTTENFEKFIDEFRTKSRLMPEGKILISYKEKIESCDFGNIVNNLQELKQTYFYWEKPDKGCTALGIESLFNVSYSGPHRTTGTEKEVNYWIDRRFSNISKEEAKTIPVFIGGMKFSPDKEDGKSIWKDYSDSDWFIPKYIIINNSSGCSLISNFIYDDSYENNFLDEYRDGKNYLDKLSMGEPAEILVKIENSNLFDPGEKENWKEKVELALDKISSGKFTKIVMSRKVTSLLSEIPSVYNLLKQLADHYPKCYIFAFAKDESTFFGASPEKLAKISGGWIEADALAGSIQRGDNEDEDRRLADELLVSKKNLAEQNAVVDFITNSFKRFTDDVIYEKEPVIRKLSNIQHLWTQIKAKLNSENSIFSILKEIHPTPAICGVPWSGALTFIQDTEGYNRGLYAGIIGWFNFENEGEFAVAIRSALLVNKQLHAFAGCGIVEGSDPESEFEETELKLQPILSLFPNEKAVQS